MDIILYLAEAFLIAYIMRMIAYRFNIPAVSGYVVGGVVLGGSLFVWIPGWEVFREQWLFGEKALGQLEFITHIALGAIALGIGAELEWKRIKLLGRSIFVIALFEAIGAFVLVFLAIQSIWHDTALALLLGSVSSATAPAATVSVIQQYRAKGPLTNTILAVVGIDDAISFIIFAFAVTVAKSSFEGAPINLVTGLALPLSEIIFSLMLGAVIGFIGARMLGTTHEQESSTFILGTVVLWITALASIMGLSELLANMAGGILIVNTYPTMKSRIRTVFSGFMPLFYALFFITGGAHLNVYAIPVIWMLALVYFVARSTGKISGAYLGAVLGSAQPQVRKWVGFVLLPQVGAAIALALLVNAEFGGGQYGVEGDRIASVIMNVLLSTTFITEFIGPYLTKMSLFKAGEARA